MHIEKGQVYGFIGENGAGKTTIIRMLAGLARPSAGNYELFGVKSYEGSQIRRVRGKMAAIVESPSIYPNFSAYDNIKLQCGLLGVTDPSVIDRVLSMTGLSYLRNEKKNAAKFSLGMRQRLGIAMALVGDPEFIILDEPMNGLDPEGIVEIRELILKLNRENGITFLISSHILDELQKVATNYGFIHRGELVRELTAKELSEQCKKSLDIYTSDAGETAKLISEGKLASDFKFLENGGLRIYDEVNINRLVVFLDGKGIRLEKINSNEGSIEEFYLDMIRKFQRTEGQEQQGGAQNG